MDIIYYTINFLGYLGGFACVAMICVAVLRIMTGNENEDRKYFIRIKNGIIALVLLLTIATIKNLVFNYFPYVQSDDAIGDWTGISVSISDGLIEAEAKDKLHRWTIAIDGQYYVKTDSGKKINMGTFLNSWKPSGGFDVFKLYDDCQGATSGTFAKEQYYMYWKKRDGENTGFLFSSDLKGNIHSENEFDELVVDPWVNSGKPQQYKHIDN